jgi:hypothetical protein
MLAMAIHSSRPKENRAGHVLRDATALPGRQPSTALAPRIKVCHCRLTHAPLLPFNSVMLRDPKAVMVAAISAKVEDIEQRTTACWKKDVLMGAPSRNREIIPTEIALLAGTLTCFVFIIPYKAVLALTEDLRTFEIR